MLSVWVVCIPQEEAHSPSRKNELEQNDMCPDVGAPYSFFFFLRQSLEAWTKAQRLVYVL